MASLADILIVSLLVGIGRSWEFVGQWDTGVIASIGRLIRHPDQVQDDDSGDLKPPSGADHP